MPKTMYRYTGPNSAITLKVPSRDGGTADQDVILWSGQTVELPSDHGVTQTLEHQGLLVPLLTGETPAQVPEQVADSGAQAVRAGKPATSSATSATKAK